MNQKAQEQCTKIISMLWKAIRQSDTKSIFNRILPFDHWKLFGDCSTPLHDAVVCANLSFGILWSPTPTSDELFVGACSAGAENAASASPTRDGDGGDGSRRLRWSVLRRTCGGRGSKSCWTCMGDVGQQWRWPAGPRGAEKKQCLIFDSCSLRS